MKRIMRNIVPMAAAAIMLLAGCDTKDPIYDMLPSNNGTITIITDWSQIGAGNIIPPSYTARVGNYSVLLTGVTNIIENRFETGNYTGYVYNTAESVTITGTMATVAGAIAPAGATGSFINSIPGWLYTCRLDETINKNEDHTFMAVMEQQVRELTFVLTPTGDMINKISTVMGIITGVAKDYDMSDGTYSTPSNVVIMFTKQTTGEYTGKYTATVRFLGVVGNNQAITLSTTYTDHMLGTKVALPINISSNLAAFNTDKRTPIELDLELETPTVYTGVLINGIHWAEYNVDDFGTFAATPESSGMLYQWNRKIAWLATGSSPVSSPAGEVWKNDNMGVVGDIWETHNDPCPEGWRVPTRAEQAKLLDNTNVDREWIGTGVKGFKFTDKTSGVSIFFPAVGYRNANSNGSLTLEGSLGLYGSGSSDANNSMWFFMHNNGTASHTPNYRANGASIRCIRAD